MTSEAYVFVEGLEDTDQKAAPVICGKIWYDAERSIGRFRYGRSWLERSDAFSLDPIHLPLTDELFETRLNKGIFGVLRDAGADAWGKKLITQLRKTKPKNELEYLIAGATMGVGALTFSLSSSATKPKVSRNSLDDIELLIGGKNAILNAQSVSVEVKKAFQYGDSMGGARPKTVLNHQNELYLIKFNRPDDLFNVARVEHATMQMLGQVAGVDVADSRVISGTEDMLMVKRFDRHNTAVSKHFISAASILNRGAVSELSLTDWYSYGALAEYLRKHSDVPDDAQQLYKRMVFNVFIGNTDDHSRNHAVLFDLKQRNWGLSPAYDVLPVNNHRQHALGIGNEGRTGTIENLLSQCKRFAIQPARARKIINELSELVHEWPVYFSQAGVQDGDIERLKSVIPDIE